ncbi:hypothetical protein BCR42DRAFT_435879 [Absidia repens]|uniref:Uncharacterized protein n=1 Tax=Absidia repens TaxID=90262 RepID=A0A1X2IL94_9FUNG|nr:hypothetical protein BCR42DRAFT_435879 [Absidia repens]
MVMQKMKPKIWIFFTQYYASFSVSIQALFECTEKDANGDIIDYEENWVTEKVNMQARKSVLCFVKSDLPVVEAKSKNQTLDDRLGASAHGRSGDYVSTLQDS